VAAIKASGLKAVFTMANADAQGALINDRLQAACTRNPGRFKWIPHLGHRRYLSCLKYFAVMVGNSSSGLTEAPSFRLPVVNIGDRQRGRVRAANVIDVSCSRAAILRGIMKAISRVFGLRCVACAIRMIAFTTGERVNESRMRSNTYLSPMIGKEELSRSAVKLNQRSFP